jgi:hypothetical protein
VSSIVEAVLMLVLLVITAFSHLIIHKTFHRKTRTLLSICPHVIDLTIAITKFLPMSLATEKYAEKQDRRRKRHTGLVKEAEEVDAFTRDGASHRVTKGSILLSAASR